MHILLAGQGNMAKAVEAACFPRGIKLTKLGQDFDHSNEFYGKPVAIHFGSGSQLLHLVDVCERLKMPLIQGSTKLSVELPSDRQVRIVNAPNLSIPMIRFMTAFPIFAQAIKTGMKLRIVESHQSAKADTSGTARAVARTLNVPESAIKPIRDPGIQILAGVPEEHLGGHAYHDFIFTGQGVEIRVSTKILGRATYAEGALILAQGLENHATDLGFGIHELNDAVLNLLLAA